MKSIRFDNLQRNKWWLFLILLSLLLILGGIWEPVELENPYIYKWGSVIGFFIQSVLFSRMFWYKNYVQYNKKGIFIRVNSIIGPSFKYSEIKSVDLNGDNLEVILFGGRKKKMVDLKGINQKDKQRLYQIVKENIAF